MVRPTPKPVVLVLTSYESVVWQVEVEPNARLDAVYYGGYPIPSFGFRQAPRSRTTSAHTYAYSTGAARERRNCPRAISEQLGVPLVSFQGPNEAGRFQVPVYHDRSIVRR